MPGGANPKLKGVEFEAQELRAAAVNSSINTISSLTKSVVVTGVVNDANDWITLPNIASVPIGHTITIVANAGANFELRTPTSSNEKINDVDSDGTQEYLVTDTHTVYVTKRTTTGWVAFGFTKLGAIVAAVVPD